MSLSVQEGLTSLSVETATTTDRADPREPNRGRFEVRVGAAGGAGRGGRLRPQRTGEDSGPASL